MITSRTDYTKYKVFGNMSCEDYRNAPSKIGPLSHEWEDKPHRLVYDLIKRVAELEEEK